MPSLEELQGWRDELFHALSTGVLRTSYMGRDTTFRSQEHMKDSLRLLDAEIAKASGTAKPRVRGVYTPGAKHL